MRRLIFEEPVSQTAIWSQRLARYAIALALLAVIAGHARGFLARFFAAATLRPDNVPAPNLSLFVFAAALACAALALLVALAAAIVIWRKGLRGVGRIVRAVLLVVVLLAYPAYLGLAALQLPWLADISTDIADPPNYSLSRVALKGRGGWTPEPLDAGQRQAQAVAYPEIQSLLVGMDEKQTFKQAWQLAEQMHWTILDSSPPIVRRGQSPLIGHIDALAHTSALGLPVAITIRITPLEGETRVDVRAASRYLPHDFGAGAALIGKLTEALQEKDDEE